MVITKSISRFARNTVDCISWVRKLKEKNVAVYFEKENLNTLDDSTEMILTILSSQAQEESRAISTNVKCYSYDYHDQWMFFHQFHLMYPRLCDWLPNCCRNSITPMLLRPDTFLNNSR